MLSNLQTSTSSKPTTKQSANVAYKHIILRKLSCAVISSVSSQLMILLWFIFILNFSLISPLDSINVYLSTLTSLDTWFYLLLFILVVFFQSIIYAKDYILPSSYPSSRFATLKSIFSLYNMLLLILHIFIGFACVYLFLGFTNRRLLIEKNGQYVLEENTLYLLYLGSWTGFFYFISMYPIAKKVKFPVVYQQKWLQFKGNFFEILAISKQRVFWPTLYFIGMYAVMGRRLNQMFSLQVQYASHEFLVYVLVWFFPTLIYFSMNLIHFYYTLFLSEPFEFPIIPEEAGGFTLKEALEAQVPIIQQLACQDIYLLSTNSQSRRGVLFTLSFPGNHPHNWNSILHNLLTICREYTNRLNAAMNAILLPDKLIENDENSTSKSDVYKNVKVRRIGQLCSPHAVNVVAQPSISVKQAKDQLLERLKAKLDWFVANAKEKIGINYLFKDHPDASIQRCLAEGQMIFWVVRSLAILCEASLTEDRFGIVQKDLPIIITTLAEMKLSVEKLGRLPALNRRGVGLDEFNCNMKLSIMSALKRSIFSLVCAFGPYLNEMNLKEDIYGQLINFLPVKNGY